MSIQEQRKHLTITSPKYIPSPEHWKEMFRKYHFYEVKERVAIDEIKTNRSLLDFNKRTNRLDQFLCIQRQGRRRNDGVK